MIDRSVLLSLAPTEAFDLFTQKINLWWPPDRRHLNDVNSELYLLADGRFYERASNGTELDLGRVRVWDAPKRIVLDFYLGTDAAHPTEVEIRFDAEGDGTRISVNHRPRESSIEMWDKRAAIFARSWESVLSALQSASQNK
jgi:Activator of Hsp90 ATPase homolog 1-like protein